MLAATGIGGIFRACGEDSAVGRVMRLLRPEDFFADAVGDKNGMIAVGVYDASVGEVEIGVVGGDHRRMRNGTLRVAR